MATGTSNVAAMNGNWIDQVYEDALFVARARNIMGGLVTVFNDRQGAESRANLEYPQTVAQSVGENDDFSNPTKMTKTQLANLTPGEVMAQHVLTDRRRRSDPQNAYADASRELGNALADKVETDLLSTFSSLTGGTVDSGTAVITWSNLFAARTQLAGSKVPGPYIAVLHEYQWFELAKSASVAGLSAKNNSSDLLIDDIHRQWYVGSVGDLDIYTSANLTAGTAVTAGVFNRSAIALDVRQSPTMEPERDASARAWELNIVSDYAYGVWRPAFGAQLITPGTAPTA